MNKYIVIIIIGLSLITAFSGCVGVDYIILGDTVYYGNTNFNMSVTPHTLYDSGFVDFSFILYNEAFNNTLMDGFWLFNTSQSYPSSTNYSGDLIHKSISWDGWTDLYAVKNVSVKTNKYYNISAYINLKFNSSGKYCFGVKKSSVSWSDAWANGEGNPNGFFWIDPWWNNYYAYNKKIIINHSYIDTDLTNFTVLIYNDNQTMLEMMDDGDSLRFTPDNSTLFNYEIEHFDDDGIVGMEVWVNVSSVSSSVDTVFYMYYNNSDAPDGQNIVGTWDSNYVGVWHMGGSSYANIIDSTDNNNDCVSQSGTPEYLKTGMVAFAVDFEKDSSEYLNMSNDASLTGMTVGTVESWCKFETVVDPSYVSCFESDGERIMFYIGSGKLSYYYRNGLPTEYYAKISADAQTHYINKWYYQATTQNASPDNLQPTIWLNDSKPAWSWITQDPPHHEELFFDDINDPYFYIGRGGLSSALMDGLIDEVRISNSVRSDAWIKASFHSSNMTTGFIVFGGEIVNLLPVVSGEVPLNNSVGNTFPSLTWNCTIYDDLSNINWSIECSNGEEDGDVNDTDGYKSLSLNGLEDDTEYTVYVNVSEYYGRSVFYWFNFTTLKGCECLITNPFPVNDSVDVNFTYVNMTIDINSSCGIADFVNISLVCVSCSTMNYTNFTSVYNGTYFLNISDLNGFSSYIWYVNTSCNGTHNYTFFIFTTKLSGGGCDCDDIRVIMRQELNNYNAFKESDDMNIGFEMDIIGLLAVIIFYLLLVYRKDFVFGIFCSVISLSVGLFYLGNTVFSIYWWLGVILFLVCLYSSFLSLYYGLSGKYFDTLNK